MSEPTRPMTPRNLDEVAAACQRYLAAHGMCREILGASDEVVNRGRAELPHGKAAREVLATWSAARLSNALAELTDAVLGGADA